MALYDKVDTEDNSYYIWRNGNMGLLLYWNGKAWTKYEDNAKTFTLEQAQEFVEQSEYECFMNTYSDNTNWDFSNKL